MDIVNWKKLKPTEVKSFPYRGKHLPVNKVTIRWLSNVGLDDSGSAEYGLRYFTVGVGGDIPIHKHYYSQTMYILEGEFDVISFREDDDSIIETKRVGPGDSVYIPSMEPHEMRNAGKVDGSFLCCICNVYQNEDTL